MNIERRDVIQRRVKVNRRRQIDPTTCERDYTPEEIEFMSAMDDYKRSSGRMFPTCSEVLEVIKSLGYEKSPQTGAVPPPAIGLPARHRYGRSRRFHSTSRVTPPHPAHFTQSARKPLLHPPA